MGRGPGCHLWEKGSVTGALEPLKMILEKADDEEVSGSNPVNSLATIFSRGVQNYSRTVLSYNEF